jgi:ribosomal protein L24
MGILRKVFKSMFERDKWRILRGDKVMIMAGKDRGQVGTVLKVIRDDKYPRVVVEGLNLVSCWKRKELIRINTRNNLINSIAA